MHYRLSFGRQMFLVSNYVFLAVVAIVCIFPIIHIVAVSFSSASAAADGRVNLWPVDFSLSSYSYVLHMQQFMTSFLISVKRVLIGASLNMAMTVLIAYPLSHAEFRSRNFYLWFFLITMLFSGGLIPWYMVIRDTGIMNTIWALVLPGAVPVFNVIIMLNFFRSLPRDVEDAAKIDGAGDFRVLWRIYLPLSMPALATLTLFSVVNQWNSWFDGLILMNTPAKWPLQSFLQTLVITFDPNFMTEAQVQQLSLMSNQTIHATEIFIAAFPILIIYPFLQKYFIKGITLGSVNE